ncbi:hypothetical protein E2542_SST08881 [Spatholobus suberectus]|nr:hypothetical protein E2542_SST08881 [Spatholobus suberectus]
MVAMPFPQNVQTVDYVFEVESVRRGEMDLHEMRVLELAVLREEVNDGDFSRRFGLGLWFSLDWSLSVSISSGFKPLPKQMAKEP